MVQYLREHRSRCVQWSIVFFVSAFLSVSYLNLRGNYYYALLNKTSLLAYTPILHSLLTEWTICFVILILSCVGLIGVFVFYLLRIFQYVNVENSAFTLSVHRKKVPINIFISYRHADSGSFCEKLTQYLQQKGKIRHIFHDTESIYGGADFSKVLESSLASTEVVFVLIGRNWLSATNAQGQRRLSLNDDFVRWEIATALQLNKTIIPILIDSATMPAPEDLPVEIRDLAYKSPISIHAGQLDNDMSRLLFTAKTLLRPRIQTWLSIFSVSVGILGILACIFDNFPGDNGYNIGVARCGITDARFLFYIYDCSHSPIHNTIYAMVFIGFVICAGSACILASTQKKWQWLIRNMFYSFVFLGAALIYWHYAYQISWNLGDYQGRGDFIERTDVYSRWFYYSWWVAFLMLGWIIREIYMFSRGKIDESLQARSQIQ
jgi:TIR domain